MKTNLYGTNENEPPESKVEYAPQYEKILLGQYQNVGVNNAML